MRLEIDGIPRGTGVAAIVAFLCERARVSGAVLGKVTLAGRRAVVEVADQAAAARIAERVSGAVWDGAALVVRGPAAATTRGDDHYARLAALLEIERREEAERLRADAATLSLAEREARGEHVARLVCLDEESGLSGRTLLTFARAAGGDLPPAAARVGEVVSLVPPAGPAGEQPPSGVVARRTATRVTVALDDEAPDWVGAGPLALERVPDDTTHRRLIAAVERVRKARGERLAELREIADGGRPPGRLDLRPAPDLDGLDPSQRAAVEAALAAPDLALIHGPPGTGKTTALTALIRAAVARGERVLACAPSNAAVDVIAERLVAAGVEAVRLGHPARISEPVLAHSLEERARAHDDAALARRLLREADALRRRLAKAGRAPAGRDAVRAARAEVRALRADARRSADAAIEKVIEAAQVVCATLTGADGAPLGDRRFDLVVIDEAAQALEPACWIALARARRAVLAGDHCQLPPTVISLEAARGGLSRTLFERLHGRLGAERVRMLETQYRMHAAIAAFPNERFYGGALLSAAANAAHTLADMPGVAPGEWTRAPLTLFDTSGAGFEETRDAPPGAAAASVRNEGEADLAAKVVAALRTAGVPARAIGVITPYAAQVAAIRERLAEDLAAGLEVDTADGFQGREREAVVLSLVRNNEAGEVGFLADHRRTNVALTRARRALFVIGDGATLGRDPFYADLFAWCEAAGALRSAWELL